MLEQFTLEALFEACLLTLELDSLLEAEAADA